MRTGFQFWSTNALQHFQRELQENEFGDKDKSSIEWTWGKAGVDVPKVQQLMLPETACLLRSAYVGDAALRFSHVDDKMRHLDGLHKTVLNMQASERDRALVLKVYEALKRAPWTLTRSYLEKLDNGFLVFNGLGLHCKIGAPGFTFERLSVYNAVFTDRSKFVTTAGGNNMSHHQTKERPLFLAKMLDAYRTTEIADEANDRKDEEMRHYLLRCNSVLLQARDIYRLHLSLLTCCLPQTREDTMLIGGGELPAESRRFIHANHRKLMEDIHAAQLGRSNPYDLCDLPSHPALCRAYRITSCDFCHADTRTTRCLPVEAIGGASRRARVSARRAGRADQGMSGIGGIGLDL